MSNSIYEISFDSPPRTYIPNTVDVLCNGIGNAPTDASVNEIAKNIFIEVRAAWEELKGATPYFVSYKGENMVAYVGKPKRSSQGELFLLAEQVETMLVCLGFKERELLNRELSLEELLARDIAEVVAEVYLAQKAFEEFHQTRKGVVPSPTSVVDRVLLDEKTCFQKADEVSKKISELFEKTTPQSALLQGQLNDLLGKQNQLFTKKTSLQREVFFEGGDVDAFAKSLCVEGEQERIEREINKLFALAKDGESFGRVGEESSRLKREIEALRYADHLQLQKSREIKQKINEDAVLFNETYDEYMEQISRFGHDGFEEDFKDREEWRNLALDSLSVVERVPLKKYVPPEEALCGPLQTKEELVGGNGVYSSSYQSYFYSSVAEFMPPFNERDYEPF